LSRDPLHGWWTVGNMTILRRSEMGSSYSAVPPYRRTANLVSPSPDCTTTPRPWPDVDAGGVMLFRNSMVLVDSFTMSPSDVSKRSMEPRRATAWPPNGDSLRRASRGQLVARAGRCRDPVGRRAVDGTDGLVARRTSGCPGRASHVFLNVEDAVVIGASVSCAPGSLRRLAIIDLGEQAPQEPTPLQDDGVPERSMACKADSGVWATRPAAWESCRG